MEIINCTAREIVVMCHDEMKIYEAGTAASVKTTEINTGSFLNGVPVLAREIEIIDLPQQKSETFLIVSAFIFLISDRKDLITPDTGESAIRDKDGRIISITQFIQN